MFPIRATHASRNAKLLTIKQMTNVVNKDNEI